jgi:hypothetical protein
MFSDTMVAMLELVYVLPINSNVIADGIEVIRSGRDGDGDGMTKMSGCRRVCTFDADVKTMLDADTICVLGLCV